MAKIMLVDLDRCIGCWTCAMACKVGNHLDDDDYRIEVETHGSGAGIDRPAGVYPNLHMSWQPIYKTSCTFCPERLVEGQKPFCVSSCPTFALAFGDPDDAVSKIHGEKERLENSGARFFQLQDGDTRANVTYAQK